MNFQLFTGIVNLIRVLLLSMLLCGVGFAQDQGTVEQDISIDQDTSSVSFDSIFVYTRTLAIEILAWPFENIVEPAVTLAISPIRPPIDYVFQERIVNKAINLVTFGKRENIIINPIMKIGSGPGSLIGVAYRHFRVMGDDHSDALRLTVKKMINGDLKVNTKYSRNKLFGTGLAFSVNYGLSQLKGNAFMYPENGVQYFYADSSWSYGGSVSYPVFMGWNLTLRANRIFQHWTDPIDRRNFDDTSIDSIPDELYNRGFPNSNLKEDRKFIEKDYVITLSKSTRDSRFIPTKGYLLNFDYTYSEYDHNDHNIDSDIKNINYHAVSMRYQRYILLGKQTFSLSKKESNQNKRFLRNLNVSKLLDIFDVRALEKNFLQRKVLIMQWVMRQMIDDKEGHGAFNGYSGIGNGTPLRGYSQEGVNKAMVGASMEYRFPLLRLVDGTFFVDLATVGSTLTSFNELSHTKNFKTSWGIGMRMRKSGIFISRLQLGVAGFHTLKFNLTVNPAY